jgi:hypothetical protein
MEKVPRRPDSQKLASHHRQRDGVPRNGGRDDGRDDRRDCVRDPTHHPPRQDTSPSSPALKRRKFGHNAQSSSPATAAVSPVSDFSTNTTPYNIDTSDSEALERLPLDDDEGRNFPTGRLFRGYPRVIRLRDCPPAGLDERSAQACRAMQEIPDSILLHRHHNHVLLKDQCQSSSLPRLSKPISI